MARTVVCEGAKAPYTIWQKNYGKAEFFFIEIINKT